MRVQNSSALYRISRFHVGSNPRRRRLWARYRAVPVIAGGYVLVTSFVMAVSFVVFVEVCHFFHAGLRHILIHAADVLQNLNH